MWWRGMPSTALQAWIPPGTRFRCAQRPRPRRPCFSFWFDPGFNSHSFHRAWPLCFGKNARPSGWGRPEGVIRSGGSVIGEFFRVVVLCLYWGAGRAASATSRASYLSTNNAHIEYADHPGCFGGGSRVWEGAYARMFMIYNNNLCPRWLLS